MRQNYNSSRPKLQLPEYGRHIQEMVESLKTIEDQEERNRQAHAVIAVMGNLNPLLRDTADFTHKLWDHLYMISNFELEVDSPYPRPTRELIEAKPNRLRYRRGKIAFKHYGRYVSNIIDSLSKEPDSEAVASAVDNIARYMRTKSFEYNQEHPNNEVIIKDIRRMSNGDITIDEDAISNLKSEYKSNQNSYSSQATKSSKGGKSMQQRGQHSNKGHHNNGQHSNRNFTKSSGDSGNGGVRRNQNNRRGE